MKEAPSVEDEISALHAKSLIKFRRLRLSAQGRRKMQARIHKNHVAPFFVRGSNIFLKRNAGKKLIAALLITNKPHYTSGVCTFMIFTMPGDHKSLLWAQSILKRPVLEWKCRGILSPWQRSLLPTLRTKSIRVRSVCLEGGVKESLKRLQRHYGKFLRTPAEEIGLDFRPARNKMEVAPYLRILKREYGKNPQFGTFVADPNFLNQLKRRLTAEIARKEKFLWLAYRKKKLIGGVDIVEFPRGPDGKKRAGFGVNLSSPYQGKKIARALYASILEQLQARKVDLYFGNTGQPGVMRLGKIMGRKLKDVEVDRGLAKAFPALHFKDWL